MEFPNPVKDVARFNQWLSYINNKKLNSIHKDLVYKPKSVNCVHFKLKSYLYNKLLQKDTVPTLQLGQFSLSKDVDGLIAKKLSEDINLSVPGCLSTSNFF